MIKGIPKISVLIICYKQEELIKRAIDSLLSQKEYIYEICVSDDCSPEPVYDVCKRFLQDTRFSYRRNEQNIGGGNLVKHWNMLVEMCETDYCIMSSDDDVYSPTFLEEINNLTEKYPDVCLLRGKAQRINTNGEITAIMLMLQNLRIKLMLCMVSLT